MKLPSGSKRTASAAVKFNYVFIGESIFASLSQLNIASVNSPLVPIPTNGQATV